MLNNLWIGAKSGIKHQVVRLGLIVCILLFVGSCACKPIPVKPNQEAGCEESAGAPLVGQADGGGIQNIGNSCYMNAVLQIFNHFYPKAFVGANNSLTQAGQKIMDQLQKGQSVDDTMARAFLTALQNTPGSFKPRTGTQEDASELLIQLIDQLQWTQASTQKVISQLPANSKKSKNKKSNKTSIASIETNTMPTDAWHIFKIPNEATNATMQENFNQAMNPEIIAGYAGWKNKKLRGGKVSKKLSNLDKLCNNTLIIQIDRVDFINHAQKSVKMKKTVQDPFRLVIHKEQILDGKTDIAYQLIGFILHSGNQPTSGHYVTYAKKGAQWYLYNDSSVSEITAEEAENKAKQAYLYFYQQHGKSAA